MFGTERLTRVQRYLVGGAVLLSVDIIWVASSELTQYIFKNLKFNKPFFSGYAKMSMFILYLTGFLFYKPWLQKCKKRREDMVVDDTEPNTHGTGSEYEKLLGDPIYVPVKYEERNSGTESDDSLTASAKLVRFSSLSEVRQLPDNQAEEAMLARLSYNDAARREHELARLKNTFSVKQVIYIAFVFSFIYFGGNIAYQVALKDSSGAGLVNVLSSSSSLFTTLLAAMFPSAGNDQFTLSKLIAVIFSMGGVAMVSLSDSDNGSLPLASFWALAGAILYSVFLVMLKRKVQDEHKMDITMFFGFVGVFIAVSLWPLFFVLDATKWEEFQWPTKLEWLFLVINGLVGTVLAECLWLWGCFLTSSVVGTLSLSLTTPLSMFADLILDKKRYGWMFYVGSVPIFVSFFAVCILSHYENWDPVLMCTRKAYHFVRKRQNPLRLSDVEREQTQSLIKHSHHHHHQINDNDDT